MISTRTKPILFDRPEPRLDQRDDQPYIPPPPQKPRRYCFILLRGCQTRWEDDAGRVAMTAEAFRDLNMPYLLLEWDAEKRQYIQTQPT